jgi:ribosomal protein S6--L-glutamate ligase
MKIAIMTSSPVENQLLVDTAIKMGHECRILDHRKFYMLLSENKKGFDKLFYDNGGDEPEHITAKSLDCVINRIGSHIDHAVLALRFMTENLGVWCPNNPYGILFCSNKSWTLQRLSSMNIPIPRTLLAISPTHVAWSVDKIGSLPLILKTNRGSKGKTVSILDTKRSANSMFEFCQNLNLSVLIEEYIECESSDIRAWVIGDRVALAMKRTSTDKSDFKANISRSGTGVRVTLSPEDEKLCVDAAHAVGLQIAGVDMLKSTKTGESFIVEINGNPGIRIISICEHNVFEDIIKFCEDHFKKRSTGSKGTGATDTQGTSAITKTSMLLDECFFENLEEAIRQKANLSFPLGGLLLGGLLR